MTTVEANDNSVEPLSLEEQTGVCKFAFKKYLRSMSKDPVSLQNSQKKLGDLIFYTLRSIVAENNEYGSPISENERRFSEFLVDAKRGKYASFVKYIDSIAFNVGKTPFHVDIATDQNTRRIFTQLASVRNHPAYFERYVVPKDPRLDPEIVAEYKAQFKK